jgi:trimeric autotransporter adhesin
MVRRWCASGVICRLEIVRIPCPNNGTWGTHFCGEKEIGAWGKSMGGFRRRWTLVGVVMTILVRVACAQVTTTTVQDTVYRADGTVAGGSVVISWSAFTTAAGRAVPTGTTSVTIGTGGSLTVALSPNAGATPMGSYYTAVFHLNDGSTSREYWVIPVTVAGGGPTTLSAIRNSVLPVSVAMQTVSKSYVDTAIAAAVAGTPLDSTPYVLKAGDTMTGPLVLPADPVSDNQAADKHYVDVNVAAVAGGLGRKVDELPSVTQVVAQPTGTRLEVNNLNGSLYATPYISAGGDGIANALASPDCASGCDVWIENTYPSNEGASLLQIPAKTRVVDERGGSEAEIALNPLSPTQNGTSVTRDLTLVSTQSAVSVKTAFPGASQIDAVALRITSEGLAGGSNQFPEAIESTTPYFKSSFSATNVTGVYNTVGQHVLNNNSTFCYGVGDCLLGSQVIRASGGTRDSADEGTHPFDLDIAEDTAVFRGNCTSGCTTGSTILTITSSADAGTQGEGRFLIDKNPAKILTTGTLTGGSLATPFAKAEFSGTSFATSVFLSATTAATSQPNNIAPGTVTVGIATSGVAGGFATNTAALPSGSGVACVADPDGSAGSSIANFETANYTVIDGTHLQLTLNKVHGVGAVIAVGGLCGYGLEQTVDNVGTIRQVFIVMGSSSATELYYIDARTAIVGIPGSTSAYQNFHQNVASISRTGNIVSVTMTGNIQDVSGLTFTVSGVADSSYNGNYVVTSTGPNTLTYPSTGANSTSSGGTLSFLTGAFVLYPMAEVLGVFDPATKTVDGFMQLAANTVPWAAGDSVELPHYFQEDVDADLEEITQYTPRPQGNNIAGLAFNGNVGPSEAGWVIENMVPASNYLGNGGLHNLPTTAYQAIGPWNTILTTQAGDQSLFRVSCNSHGCNRFDSDYALFALNSAVGVDLLTYAPESSSVTWGLDGAVYTFSPTSFSAQTINVQTLNANTITGGVSATAITSGTISVARLPAFGPSGTTHSAGIVPDPGATAGTTRFLREDGTFAVPAGGGGGGSGGTPTIAVGTAAGTGASATVTGNNLAGVISVATGTGTIASATLATVTFNGALATAPQGCALMSRNANASGQVAMIYTTAPSTTTWTIAVSGGAVPPSVSSYQWSYQCN